MVSLHFLGGEELTKICSKCVRSTLSELHTFLPLHYTIAIVDHQWRCYCPAVRTMNDSKHGTMHFLGGEERTKFFPSRTQSQTRTLYPMAIEYQWRCFFPAVRIMNASKNGADKNLFQVRPSVRATHLFASSTMEVIVEYRWRCCCSAVRTMNASKLGTNAVRGLWGADKNLFQVRTSYTVTPALYLIINEKRREKKTGTLSGMQNPRYQFSATSS